MGFRSPTYESLHTALCQHMCQSIQAEHIHVADTNLAQLHADATATANQHLSQFELQTISETQTRLGVGLNLGQIDPASVNSINAKMRNHVSMQLITAVYLYQ